MNGRFRSSRKGRIIVGETIRELQDEACHQCVEGVRRAKEWQQQKLKETFARGTRNQISISLAPGLSSEVN